MVEIERDIEEVLGADSLVHRTKSNGNSNQNQNQYQYQYQYHHTVFDSEGPIDGPAVEEHCEVVSRSSGPRVEFEQYQVEEGEVFNGSVFGGSHENEIEDAIGQSEGSETPNGMSRMESQVVSDASTSKSSLETDARYLEIPEHDENTSIFSTAAAKTSHGDHGIAVNGYTNGTVKPDGSTVLEEPKEDSPEPDVERVLKTQETHDLFCPNCNCCITKRVILRRRKRKIQELSSDEEIPIPEPVPEPSPQEPEIVEESIEETECGAFRCLSCFSIFIPIGRGFKLFSFRDRGLNETVQDAPRLTPSEAPTSGPQVEPGTVNELHLGAVTVQQQSPHHSQPELLPVQGHKPSLLPLGEQEINMAVVPDTKLQLTEVGSMTLPAEQTSLTKLKADGENKLLDVNNINGTVTDENEVTVGKQEGLKISPLTGNQVVLSVVQEPHQTVISVTEPTETSPETEPLLPPVPDTRSVPATAPAAVPATDDGEPQIDIVKSIIYGGLLESIASLSVVTAAAGANAKTLNILALGAANMFGGLFVLAHNLRVLKHENSDERYEEVLGRPGHFTFHSIVAVLSYIVFGLLPPVIYAFTFRESDNRDYKLIVVATASLLCIILLALGKSYTKRPPKEYMKTLLYYISLWIMVCGVSFVAGDLFDFLLQKLGWFESSSSIAMTVGEFRPVKMPWASN